MIKPLLALAFSCLCLTASAQDEPNYKKSRITFAVGLASPVGDFGDNNWEDRNPPFAKNGMLLSLSYSKGLGKNFALGTTLARRSNAYSSIEYLNYRKDTNYSYTSASGTSWASNMLLGDLYLLAPRSKMSLYAKASVGVAFNSSAGYVLNTAFTQHTRHAGKSTNLAYGLAGGLQIDNGRYGFGLEAGLLATSPEFEVDYSYRDTEPRPEQDRTDSLEQDMKTLNITAMLSYSF